MPRYKMIVEYDGGPYCGFQKQIGVATVQGALETALAAFMGEQVSIIAAGRTDTGVHALGQVVHFDAEKQMEPARLMGATNAHLRPNPVAVLAAEVVNEDFHARFSATKRHYLYRLSQRRAPLTVERGRAWRVSKPVSVSAMAEAASHFVGHHDFSTFRAAGCQARSPVKTMDEAMVHADASGIRFNFSARSFLHSQVRSMVGSLVEVGLGKEEPNWIADLLEHPDRAKCGPIAPPEGLYLMQVDY